MSWSVFAVIALSSLSWSLFDLSRKKIAERLEPVPAVVWLMFLQAPVYLGFLAMGMESWVEPWSPPTIVRAYWAPALASIVLNAIANACFISSVRRAPLSLAIPMLSLTPVFSAIGAFAMLGELTTWRQAAGILIIVTSTFWLARQSTQAGARSGVDAGASVGMRPDEAADSVLTEDLAQVPADIRKGLWLMVFVALLWATTPVLDKVCLQLMPPSEHAFIQCLGVAFSLSIWLWLQGGRVTTAQVALAGRWIWGAVAVASIALLTQFWAISRVPVGVFEALKRSCGLLAALALGFLVFREPLTRLKFATVIVIGGGIFVLLT